MERPGISLDTIPFPFYEYDETNVPLTKEELLADEHLTKSLDLVAKHTWRFLSEYLDENTGLPIDRVDVYEQSQEAHGITSPSNIGLALLSLGAAEDLSLENENQAEAKAAKIIHTLQDIEKEHGLFLNWYYTDSSEAVKTWPGAEEDLEPFVSSVDNAWIAAGLLYAREKFPALAAQINSILEAMDFLLFHNPDLNSFSGGYFPEQQELAVWQYDLRYLSESRILYYICYLLGHIDKQQLDELYINFPMQTFGGSAFEVLMPGLIFDEEEIAIEAIAEMIQSQIDAGKAHGIWGYSPCVDGEGTYKEYGTGYYAENGFNVVAIYAILMALEFNPDLSIPVLTRLVKELDVWSEYGFYDSADLAENKTSPTLIYLDQAMIFLAVANLKNGSSVRKIFSKLLKKAERELKN